MACPNCGINHARGPRYEAIRFDRKSQTHRPRFGACPGCEAPEDIWCYPICTLYDPWMPADEKLGKAIKVARTEGYL